MRGWRRPDKITLIFRGRSCRKLSNACSARVQCPLTRLDFSSVDRTRAAVRHNRLLRAPCRCSDKLACQRVRLDVTRISVQLSRAKSSWRSMSWFTGCGRYDVDRPRTLDDQLVRQVDEIDPSRWPLSACGISLGGMTTLRGLDMPASQPRIQSVETLSRCPQFLADGEWAVTAHSGAAGRGVSSDSL
jgi:hypothetical protein